MDALKPTCQKCGAPFEIGADGLPFCNVCKVRLGYIAFSITESVHPGPDDWYQKQIDEPILDTYIYETYGRYGVEYDERDDDRTRERVETRYCEAELANLGFGRGSDKPSRRKRAG